MSELYGYARHESKLSKVGADGKTLRETLKVVERMKGFTPPELVNPFDCPLEILYLWKWFNDLNQSRAIGLAPGPLTHSEMKAYFDLIGERPEHWELEVLRSLDRISRKPEIDNVS